MREAGWSIETLTRYVNSNWSTDLNMKLRLPGPMPHRKINIF